MVLTVGVYYCLATELCYAAPEVKTFEAEARGLHKKILSVAEDLLPPESPLVEYLKVTYTKHFGGVRQSSPQRTSRASFNTQRSRSPNKPQLDAGLSTPKRTLSAKLKKRVSIQSSPTHRKGRPRSKLVSPERNLASTMKLLKDIEMLLEDSTRAQSKPRQPEPTPPLKEGREALSISKFTLANL